MIGSDDYTLRARVAPAVIAVAPVVVLALTAIPLTPQGAKVIPIAVAVFVLVAGQRGRDAGQSRERALFEKWGGAPSTSMMRLPVRGDLGVNDVMMLRRRSQLEQLWGDGRQMPTAQEQVMTPESADMAITEFVAVLRARTRDAIRFPLVAAENINYGFRRNCWGLRTWGLVFALITLAVSIAVGILLGLYKSPHAGYGLTIPLVSAILAAWFWKSVTEDWVYIAAKRYARSLLETLDLLLASPEPPRNGG